MATFKIKTKNSKDIDKKPRVYFTCHPADFERYFEKICEDIFKTHDCAIYYTEDLSEIIAEDEKETDLGRMNLIVIPVTFKLLSQPNRAMDEDIHYAIKEHIPILPIMMESGIDEFYSKPDKFGELQYLNPYSRDLTEISYEEKLKKYLEAVLISDEMAERIRAAFDAYIFLSYRKKDRKYANQLMKLIHSHPECRDIAIWFDEFLTPGESFRENIDKILQNSKLFTLLVTPNLLEEPNGKPNFVMGEEYPAARDSGMEILPAEMQETDKTVLENKFEGIPECVKPEDEDFREKFLDIVAKTATEANNTPEHNFLIGLAYLDGIDVEFNRELGIELIIMAAEAGLVEAMMKLFSYYTEVAIDYNKALKWAEIIYNLYSENLGEEHPYTLIVLTDLVRIHLHLGNITIALNLCENGYNLSYKVLGEEHSNTLLFLDNLAEAYKCFGNYTKALELHEKAYILKCKVFGKEHYKTLISLNNLAYIYNKLGNYTKALELNEKSYILCCKVLGEENPDTLLSLGNLANTYVSLGKYAEALKLNEKVYLLQCHVLGTEHPNTIITLNNLAITYRYLGDYIKAFELYERAYALNCKVLGEEHPGTLTYLNNLAGVYTDLGNHIKALELQERVYNLSCQVLGEKHPNTILFLNNLAGIYNDLGYAKALEFQKKVYTLECEILGEKHPGTITSLNNLAVTYRKLGNYTEALELCEKAYALTRKVFGEEHHNTLTSLGNLASIYEDLANYTKALELFGKLYLIKVRVLGEEHPETLELLEIIEHLKSMVN